MKAKAKRSDYNKYKTSSHDFKEEEWVGFGQPSSKIKEIRLTNVMVNVLILY